MYTYTSKELEEMDALLYLLWRQVGDILWRALNTGLKRVRQVAVESSEVHCTRQGLHQVLFIAQVHFRRNQSDELTLIVGIS